MLQEKSGVARSLLALNFVSLGEDRCKQSDTTLSTLSVQLIFHFVVPWLARISHLDSRTLTKVFLSIDDCQISVCMGEWGLGPPILPYYRYHFPSPSTLPLKQNPHFTHSPGCLRVLDLPMSPASSASNFLLAYPYPATPLPFLPSHSQVLHLGKCCSHCLENHFLDVHSAGSLLSFGIQLKQELLE